MVARPLKIDFRWHFLKHYTASPCSRHSTKLSKKAEHKIQRGFNCVMGVLRGNYPLNRMDLSSVRLGNI